MAKMGELVYMRDMPLDSVGVVENGPFGDYNGTVVLKQEHAVLVLDQMDQGPGWTGEGRSSGGTNKVRLFKPGDSFTVTYNRCGRVETTVTLSSVDKEILVKQSELDELKAKLAELEGRAK